MARALALFIVSVVVLIGPQATSGRASGNIHGRVDLGTLVSATEGRPNIAGLAPPPTHGVSAEQRRSVVYLETAPRGAFEDRGEMHALLDQKDETFVPHVIAIMVGGVVEFRNSDKTYHNVFSLSKTRPFDLGRYATGQSKSLRFDRPGVVRVFCDIHSHMSAFILVFAHRFFDVAEADGRYHIDNVPPGTYTLVAWNEALPNELRRSVTIPEQGGEVEATMAAERGRQ